MKTGPELPGVGRYMALGIQMVVVTAAFSAIGYWVDKKTGKDPVFLMVFFLLGAFGGIVIVWRALNTPQSGKRP